MMSSHSRSVESLTELELRRLVEILQVSHPQAVTSALSLIHASSSSSTATATTIETNDDNTRKEEQKSSQEESGIRSIATNSDEKPIIIAATSATKVDQPI